MIKIRRAEQKDLSTVYELLKHGQRLMRQSKNDFQWGDLSRIQELARMDLERGDCYILEENREAVGTFCLPVGKDATYAYVEGGSWAYEGEYGTLHRIASSGKKKGVGKIIFDWAKKRYASLRVDTHEVNHTMIRVIEASGFTYVGTIYVEDGTPRRAYEWNREDSKKIDDKEELPSAGGISSFCDELRG